MLYPSDAEAMEMYRRKMNLLEKQSSSTMAGNTLAAIVVVVLCWSSIPAPPLIVWSGLIICIMFARWRKVVGFRNNERMEQVGECYRYCARSVTINGVVWGTMIAYLGYTMDPSVLVYPFMVLCAITAGTSLLYNAHFNTFKNFAIPALLMPAAALFLSGEPLKLWIGLIVLCWFTLMNSLAGQLQTFLASSSRYETENIALIRDLEFQKEKSHRLQEELQLKSEIINRMAKRADVEPIQPDTHSSRNAG
ncbi:MAG: hypothetical protein AB8B86_19495 [Pseudomonadales bacterium]